MKILILSLVLMLVTQAHEAKATDVHAKVIQKLPNHPRLKNLVLEYLRDPKGDPGVKSLFENELLSDDVQINLFEQRGPIRREYEFPSDLFSFVNYNLEFRTLGFDTFDSENLNDETNVKVQKLRTGRPDLFKARFPIFVDEQMEYDGFESNQAFLNLVHELAHVKFIRLFQANVQNVFKYFSGPAEIVKKDGDLTLIHGNLFNYLTERYAWFMELKALGSLMKKVEKDARYNDRNLPVKETYKDIATLLPRQWGVLSAHPEGFAAELMTQNYSEAERKISYRVNAIYNVDLYGRFNTERYHAIPLHEFLGVSCEDVLK